MVDYLKRHKGLLGLFIAGAVYCTFHSIFVAISEYQKERNSIMKHIETNIDKSQVVAYSGIVTLTRKDLEKLKVANRKANIDTVGLLFISKGVSPELAEEAIESVKVRSIICASL